MDDMIRVLRSEMAVRKVHQICKGRSGRAKVMNAMREGVSLMMASKEPVSNDEDANNEEEEEAYEIDGDDLAV